jgi:uncharacterized protein (DUF2141 family)
MKFKFLIILTLFTLSRCAKQTAPTGGPEDKTPPKLVESRPKNEEVNFKNSEIQLTLDEFVLLKTPIEEIIITPSIAKKFEATAKKNKVIIKFKTDLKDSTTYSINFRESIQDITERNPANVKIAFSTGPYIDSLSISGTVQEILTEKPVSNYTVALVTASDTFNILKHIGTWITLTDKQGNFTIENLKAGHYFIYAFNDKNKNLVVDSKSENYGFMPEPIDLSTDVKGVKLGVQKLDASKLKVISSRPTFAYYNIRVSKSLVEYQITAEDKAKQIYSTLESDFTTIKVYNTIPDLDSLQIRFQAKDSTDNKIDSLIYLKFNKNRSTHDALTAKIEKAKALESNSTFLATISYSKPITQFLGDSVYIRVDSTSRIDLTETNFIWNKNLTQLSISKKIDLPKQSQPADKSSPVPAQKGSTNTPVPYQLILSKGSAISVENDTAKTMTQSAAFTKIADNAIISVSIKSKENLIVQLLDQSFKIIDQTSTPGTYKFENVPPGTYKLRIQVDLNKNGKWDPGKYQTNQPPEPLFFYTNPKGGRDFVVKANWHVGDLLISY